MSDMKSIYSATVKGVMSGKIDPMTLDGIDDVAAKFTDESISDVVTKETGGVINGKAFGDRIANAISSKDESYNNPLIGKANALGHELGVMVGAQINPYTEESKAFARGENGIIKDGNPLGLDKIYDAADAYSSNAVLEQTYSKACSKVTNKISDSWDKLTHFIDDHDFSTYGAAMRARNNRLKQADNMLPVPESMMLDNSPSFG